MKEEMLRLKMELCKTLSGPPLPYEWVLGACGRLSEKIRSGAYKELLLAAGITGEQADRAAGLLSADFLRSRLEMELGEDLESDCRYPLGVLFHIGAGNLDGLAAYSVVEGLLTGNVNLLKPPGGDGGVSAFLLSELTALEPRLAPFFHIFQVPSSDQEAIKSLADLADGVVVWGGDEAVRSVRTLVRPGVKLIEWGHKLSFAYVTRRGARDEGALVSLARHMVETGQLLCSSCQGIYLDLEDTDVEELDQFCRRFLPLLEEAASRQRRDMGLTAQNTLRAYVRQLESSFTEGIRVFRGRGVSITRSLDPTLTLSLLHGNCWVKPLPRQCIAEVLREHKEHLQTAGLLCAEEERKELADRLIRAGAVRISPVGEMSEAGLEAHDGEYPLRRYVKMVTIR